MLDKATIKEQVLLGEIIKSDIAPNVREIDEKGIYPKAALHKFGQAGVYSHHLFGEATKGGLLNAISDMAEIAQICATTAFSVWCQDALAWYIDRSDNQYLRDNYLPDIATGVRLGGTALSNPMKSLAGFESFGLRGEKVKGGYIVTGKLPWVSNLAKGHLFASIFALENGTKTMALFDSAAPEISLVDNSNFIALNGTGTYLVVIKDLFVPDELVLAHEAISFLKRIRQGFVLLQAGLATGLARGVAKGMENDSKGQRTGSFIPVQGSDILARTDRLASKIEGFYERLESPDENAFLDVLRARLEASWLVLEAAQAGAIHAGAAGYMFGSPSFRRTREAQFIAIVTPSIKHITTELAKFKK